MAKKAGVQQLQAELNNDDDFEKFIERYPEALLVLDIYSQWSGPCLPLVNALKKIKLELGGDRLQLAVCKSDHITKLRRFRQKSEPTWLFVRESKSINLMFGSNAPILIKLIKTELNNLSRPLSEMNYIEIDELHPEEQRREKIKNDLIAALELKEQQEREKKRRDYLMHCTDTILENLPDIGVTVFGPQVDRDMYKKIIEPADDLKISCKDRRLKTVTKAEFETINFACSNPLPDDIIEELTKHELMVCFWKVSDDAQGGVPRVMRQYVNALTTPRVEPSVDENTPDGVLPPILEPMKVKIPYEVEDHETCPEDENDQPKNRFSTAEKGRISQSAALEVSAENEETIEEEDEGEGQEGVEMEMPTFDMTFDDDESVHDEEDKTAPAIEEPEPKKICTRTIVLPPVWVPNDERTHAALIYIFFRPQTATFLPPDPPPEPPHIIMAFDTHKKRDLIPIADRNKPEIPYYGFFRGLADQDADEDEAAQVKFLAASPQEYSKHTPSANDKLVLQVNKRTSHMMLSLASYGATYVSPNTKVGKEEALKFFPESYRKAKTDNKEKEKEAPKEEVLEEQEIVEEAELNTEIENVDVEEIGEDTEPGASSELGEEEEIAIVEE